MSHLPCSAPASFAVGAIGLGFHTTEMEPSFLQPSLATKGTSAHTTGSLEAYRDLHLKADIDSPAETRLEVVPFATSTGAKPLKTSTQIGSFDVGKGTELFVVATDPTWDFTVLRRTETALKDHVGPSNHAGTR